jgi:glycosyltransferase involved in cell wall biosynthesis
LASLAPDHDVVHLHTLWGSGHYADLASIGLAARRFPTVLTLHDEWMLTGHCACSLGCDRWQTGCGRCPDLTIPPACTRDGTRLNAIRKRRIVQRARLHVTTVSHATRRQAQRSPIMAGKPISVVYNGIDTQGFSPGDRLQARVEMGLPAEGFLALLAGQTVEGITQGIAQQAAAALNELNDLSVTALIVGRSAPRVAETLRIPCHVRPYQETPQAMARCYRAADVTLVSSEVETFGRIAAESQACGTPVISSDAGGLPEVVGHGVGGLVVPSRRVEGFVGALRRLIDDPGERLRMGRSGAAWVRQRFAEDKIANDYVALYRRVGVAG